jgi:RHS repeat-associated protein
VTYQYDGNGNQIRKVEGGGDTEYVFDARDRLVEVRQAGNAVARYSYDSQNLRTGVEDVEGKKQILLDGIEEVADYDGVSGVRRFRWDRDPSRVDAMVGQVGAQKLGIIHDALGSTYRLLTDAQAAEATYSYDVFGGRRPDSSPVGRWGFTGRSHEVVSSGELAYYRARYYDPESARFLSVDPKLWNTSPASPYGYVSGRPTMLTDPSGEMGMAESNSPHFSEFIALQPDQWATVSRAIDYVAIAISMPRCKRAFEMGCGRKYFAGLERLVYDNSLVYLLETSDPLLRGRAYPGEVPSVIGVSKRRIWQGGLFGVAATIIHEMGHYAGIDHESRPVNNTDLSQTCVPIYRD